MTIEPLREAIARSLTSANSLAALASALAARIEGSALDPALARHVDQVVGALGLRESLAAAPAAELRPLLGEIRSFALTNQPLLFPGVRAQGWRHDEAALLEAAGEVSSGFPAALKYAVAPQLEGLGERLAQPGAAFLDVGVGVAAMAIEMARAWPSLRVVGVDPWAPSLALARARVRAAGLEARIELREQAGEQLPDENAFDLGWIPSPFVPERALPLVITRVERALKPGGWLLLPMLKLGPDALGTALSQLRTVLFGGGVSTPDAREALLREHGLVDVRTLPSPPPSVIAMSVGRKRGTP